MNIDLKSNSDSKISNIVVVGGGSSGWIAASYLHKALDLNANITVIEAPSIAKIGVGEATLPSIKVELFDFLGIPEEEWMPKCYATYKLGIKFINWKKPMSHGPEHYYHCFGEMREVDGVPLSHLWMYDQHRQGKPMEYACYASPHICEHQRSPKYSDGSPAVHYAYHFDALLISEFLKDWSVKRGVKYVQDELQDAVLDDEGNIKFLKGQSGENYSADLFIDCSGFRGFLIDEILKEPFISYADSLLTNKAVAVRTPHNAGHDQIRPYSTATALDNGWAWQIPLTSRLGNGYVYSDHFISPDEAEQELRSLLNTDEEMRHIKFRSGRRRNSWVKNCVSIGLASSFLEPLESTGIYFVYAALRQLVNHFPGSDINPVLRKNFNERISYMVEDVKDFIVLHYCTSPREDTAFWKANKYDLKISDSLQNILDLQKAGGVVNRSYHGNQSLYSTFEASFDRFWTNSNYQSIFAGVGYLPEAQLGILPHKEKLLQRSGEIFKEIENHTGQLLEDLPSHYEYLARMNELNNINV